MPLWQKTWRLRFHCRYSFVLIPWGLPHALWNHSSHDDDDDNVFSVPVFQLHSIVSVLELTEGRQLQTTEQGTNEVISPLHKSNNQKQ